MAELLPRVLFVMCAWENVAGGLTVPDLSLGVPVTWSVIGGQASTIFGWVRGKIVDQLCTHNRSFSTSTEQSEPEEGPTSEGQGEGKTTGAASPDSQGEKDK